MTPPLPIPPNGSADAAASLRMTTLKSRADYLAASRGRKQVTPGFVLQARARSDGADAIRTGFTCSRKVGNAVARNRAKRRLRALAAQVIPQSGRPGWDYVLIGRREVTARRPFPQLVSDLELALSRVHGTRT